MSSDDSLDGIHSRISLADSHLRQAANADNPNTARDHTGHARRIYDTLLGLLPRIQLKGTERVRMLMTLADLRDRLRAAGEADL